MGHLTSNPIPLSIDLEKKDYTLLSERLPGQEITDAAVGLMKDE
jgi:hypothetical protein